MLRNDPALAAEWEPRIHSTSYDPSCRPASQKAGVLMGMAMTEKQGGSDVRANTTTPKPVGSGAGRGGRAQVVLLGPYVRCVPGAGAGARVACRASCCRAGLPTEQPTDFTCSG